MHPRLARLLTALLPVLAACGDDAGHGGHTTTDAGSTPTDTGTADVRSADQDAATDAPASGDTGSAAVPRLNDCTGADYVDRSAASAERTVRPQGTTGYTPRCVTVRVGQMVTFEMDFSAHPLVSGVPHGSSVGATTPSPIMGQTSGSNAVVTFGGAGFFPFYCNRHGHVGMAGVVRVMP